MKELLSIEVRWPERLVWAWWQLSQQIAFLFTVQASDDEDAETDMPESGPVAISFEDQHEFNKLFRLHYEELVIFASQLLNSVDAGRDVAQEVFQNFWLRRTAFNRINDAKAYLFVSARNHCYDLLRRDTVYNKVEDQLVANARSEADAAQPGLEAQISLAFISKALRNALKALPEGDQEILDLYYYHGLSFQEIANQLNRDKNQVVRQKDRSLKKLREFLSIDPSELLNN